MTPHRKASPLLLLLVACGPSFHDQQVKNAKQAQARGDMVNATAHWDAACRAEADDTEACGRAQTTAAEVRTTSLRGAAPACEGGDIDACVSSLADIRRLRPNDPEVKRSLELGMTSYRSRCIKLEQAQSADSTLARLKCVADKAARVNDPAYATMLREEREHAALVFAQAAEGKSAGARYVFLRSAQCLSPRIEAGRAGGAEAQFVATAAQPITLRVRNGGSVALSTETLAPCGYVERALGPRARCMSDGPTNSPDFVLDVTATLGRTQHRTTSEVRVARYQSGIERVANPEYRTAAHEARRAQQSFEAIEQDTHDREAACKRTRSAHDCDRYNASVPVYNRRVTERDRANERLRDTPSILEHPIFSSAQYTVTHHSWATPFAISGRSLSGEPLADNGVFSREDSEHPGIAVAGVQADPLRTPTQEDFNRALRDALVAQAKNSLARAFERQATCANKPWNLDSPELECRARSELWTRTNVPAPSAWLGANVPCSQ